MGICARRLAGQAVLALFALYLLIPWSTASAQQASQEDTCPGADSAPTPTVVDVNGAEKVGHWGGGMVYHWSEG